MGNRLRKRRRRPEWDGVVRRSRDGNNPWPERLDGAQARLDYSNLDAARWLGVSVNTYECWLYGRRMPTAPSREILERFCREAANVA